MKVSMNEQVQVTLTLYGANVYNAHMWGIPLQPTYHAGDKIELPFWELAQIFGSIMYMGNTHGVPFVENQIEFEPCRSG